MADIKQIENSINYKFRDLGDGTYARVVSLDSSNVTLTGPVTVANEVEIKNDSSNAIPMEPLGIPTVARQVSVTTTSANTALTGTCKRISIRARGCDMRYSVGNTAQTADASTSHYIAQDERLDIAVPVNANIAVIRESAATANGSLAITELA
jgi:hypothetical protein